MFRACEGLTPSSVQHGPYAAAVYQRSVRRWPVAVGMVPRGEVGPDLRGRQASRQA